MRRSDVGRRGVEKDGRKRVEMDGRKEEIMRRRDVGWREFKRMERELKGKEG